MIAGRRLLAHAILMLALLTAASPAAAREIAADLSSHEIDITAGFDGAELLLFGHATSQADVLVIVRGPDAPVSVRRKERVAGIWVNGMEVAFDKAPGFYFVGVTEGLKTEEGELDSILQSTGLGARFLDLETSAPDVDGATVKAFRDALVELRTRQSLYSAEPGLIVMRKDGLFRTTVPFPDDTPVGEYTVSVYHVIDGWPTAAASTPLKVRKAGFSAFVYQIAHDEPVLYGLIAILVALGAGWFAGWAFRRS